MLDRKFIYIFLGVSTLISLFIEGLFTYVLGFSIVVILIMNRGIYYTLKANKLLTNKEVVKGYELLGKAYKAGVPFVVINGYIYIALKLGHYDVAGEVINNLLSGKVHFKLKPGQRDSLLSQKALYLWKTQGIGQGLSLLEELYDSGFKTTPFYGNFACLLQLNGDLDRAEEISLEGYDYGRTDKVTLDNLVAVYIDKKDWEQAEKYFNELIQLNPGFTEAYYHGAILALNRSDKEEALNMYEKALSYELSYISTISRDDLETLKLKIDEDPS